MAELKHTDLPSSKIVNVENNCPERKLTSSLSDDQRLKALIQNKEKFPPQAKLISIIDDVNVTFLLNKKIYKAVNKKYDGYVVRFRKNCIKRTYPEEKVTNLTLTNYYLPNFPIIYAAETFNDTKPK